MLKRILVYKQKSQLYYLFYVAVQVQLAATPSRRNIHWIIAASSCLCRNNTRLMKLSGEQINAVDNDPSFLCRIITCYETWCDLTVTKLNGNTPCESYIYQCESQSCGGSMWKTWWHSKYCQGIVHQKSIPDGLSTVIHFPKPLKSVDGQKLLLSQLMVHYNLILYQFCLSADEQSITGG